MPTMANITVKKSDGVTDIIYDALAAAAGDGTPAVWRQDTGQAAAKPVGHRPLLKVMTKFNGPKTARQVHIEASFPYVLLDTTTSQYTSKDRAVFTGMFTLPQSIPASELKEAVYQLYNLLASTLQKQIGETGYSAS